MAMDNGSAANGQIDKSLFAKATEEEKRRVEVMRESVSYWRDAVRRLLANKIATLCLIVLVIIALFAIFQPFFSVFGYAQILQGSENLPPSGMHWFGTDNLGRDLFVRCMIGTRISLSIGVISTLMVVVIGVFFGSVAGFFGGIVDMVIMRAVDILYGVPTVLIVIVLSVILETSVSQVSYTTNFFTQNSNLIIIYFVLAILYWMDMARLVRGQILSMKNNEYIAASNVLGAPNGWIIRKHLIPNSIGTIIVTATYVIPEAIFLEAFLSFIGLGVSVPMASLGSLAQSGLNGIFSFPWQTFFPSLLISVIILAFNMFGDGIRDAFDPRLRNRE